MINSKNDTPIVSVITPAFNADQYIEATIRSVIAQTYESFEFLLLDDCSTDRTAAIGEELAQEDNRICVVRLPKNYGAPAGPRNVGIQQARGKWIAFLDADDIWHPDKLRSQLEALEKTSAKFCSTQMIDFKNDGELVFSPALHTDIHRISFRSQLLKYQTPTSSVIVDADLMRATPFNEDLSYKAREDLDCWLKCHERLGYSVKVQHPMVGYRRSDQQISGKKWQMVKRHLHVMSNYRFDNGKKFGLLAVLLTANHFLLSLYTRLLQKGL